jgi:hypothetical protein
MGSGPHLRYHCANRCRSEKRGEQPHNVTAEDVLLAQLVIRTRPVNAAHAIGGPPASSPERSSITSLTLLRVKAGIVTRLSTDRGSVSASTAVCRSGRPGDSGLGYGNEQLWKAQINLLSFGDRH